MGFNLIRLSSSNYLGLFNLSRSQTFPAISNIFIQTNYDTSRGYAMKSNLPIKWVKPEKVPCFKPEKSGDLSPLKSVDLKQLAPEFRNSEELKSADEIVKRLFTLEFCNYKKTVETLRSEYIDSVKRHALDKDSPETRLAKMTADIRDMQRYMELYRTDQKTKVRLKETIDKRKRLLRYLRVWDYKLYEWVLEKLDLIYKPVPHKDVYKRVERKRSLRMLTKQYCDDIVSQHLAEYRESLQAQQESFLEEKLKMLQWIIKEESECNIEPSVTQNDIDSVKIQLENLRSVQEKPNITKT